MKVLRIARVLRAFPAGLSYWLKTTGWRATLTWVGYRTTIALGFPAPKTLKIRPRQVNNAVVVRLAGSSDLQVFEQIFQFDEYACIRNIPPPSFIVDLGANAGYASAYFLSCFPTATVLAVEPDPTNVELCRANLCSYGNRAMVVHGAVWSKRSRLMVSRENGDGREWATKVMESEAGKSDITVEAWDVPGLLAMADQTHIDLLKVDIERSELEVFGATSSSWLSNVRNICIELHGADCSEVFFRALHDFDYDMARSGELTLCLNLRPKTRGAVAGSPRQLQNR